MKTIESKRNQTMDCAKGFLMMLVILGHVIVHYDTDAYTNLAFRICYSFHMFLFMYISGWLIEHRENNFLWLWQRVQRLIVPFFLWSIIFQLYFIGTIGMQDIIRFFLSPGLWYLLVLFLCDCLLTLCVFFNNKNPFLRNHSYIVAVILFMGIYVYIYMQSVSGIADTIKMLAIYFPFYYAGYYIARNGIQISNRYIYCIMALYPFVMLFYGYKDRSAQADLLQSVFSFFSIDAHIVDKILAVFLGTGGALYNHFIVGICGCVFFWQVIRFLSRIPYVKDVLLLMGAYSLQIYIMSSFFMSPISEHVYVNGIFSFVFGIMGPIYIGKLINHSKFFNRILFGIREKKTML